MSVSAALLPAISAGIPLESCACRPFQGEARLSSQPRSKGAARKGAGKAAPRVRLPTSPCPTPQQDRPSQGYDRLVLRSEEHTSELQALIRISYAVFCLK